MSEGKSSYRQILKATSIFGGVQAFKILIAIINSKVIALLLGPTGMGFIGLYNSALSLISGITSFGLGTSAVKDVAAANELGNENRLAIIIKVIKRLVWITGLFGFVITLFLSSWLSKFTFGNTDHTVAFLWLSFTLIFQQISTGQLVILQGMRRLKQLAKASVAGSFLGLFISIPLYYLRGIDGIVPAIILSSILSMILSWYYASSVPTRSIFVGWKHTINEGREMLMMGFLISITNLIALGSSYLVRIFISNIDGIAQVGLYNAGFSIINTYVGVIFSGMSTDYYPRLAGVANDHLKINSSINQQSEIAIVILAPILTIFIVFIKWIIVILYTDKFLDISGMIHWAALGMLFKATSWSIAFILLAKGNSKLFFLNELIANIYLLAFNLLGYKFFSLDGLGLSFLIGYIIYCIQIFLISKYKYEFKFNHNFYNLFIIQLFLLILTFITVKTFSFPYNYIIGSFFIISSFGFSLKELDKRIKIKNILLPFFKKL